MARTAPSVVAAARLPAARIFGLHVLIALRLLLRIVPGAAVLALLPRLALVALALVQLRIAGLVDVLPVLLAGLVALALLLLLVLGLGVVSLRIILLGRHTGSP